MDLKKRLREEQHLRVVLPSLYNYIITELSNYNIHSYDILANTVVKNDGYQIIIKYGDAFAQSQSRFFTNEAIANLDSSIYEFIKEIGEECKETMIADYFKMMKP